MEEERLRLVFVWGGLSQICTGMGKAAWESDLRCLNRAAFYAGSSCRSSFARARRLCLECNLYIRLLPVLACSPGNDCVFGHVRWEALRDNNLDKPETARPGHYFERFSMAVRQQKADHNGIQPISRPESYAKLVLRTARSLQLRTKELLFCRITTKRGQPNNLNLEPWLYSLHGRVSRRPESFAKSLLSAVKSSEDRASSQAQDVEEGQPTNTLLNSQLCKSGRSISSSRDPHAKAVLQPVSTSQ